MPLSWVYIFTIALAICTAGYLLKQGRLSVALEGTKWWRPTWRLGPGRSSAPRHYQKTQLAFLPFNRCLHISLYIFPLHTHTHTHIHLNLSVYSNSESSLTSSTSPLIPALPFLPAAPTSNYPHPQAFSISSFVFSHTLIFFESIPHSSRVKGLQNAHPHRIERNKGRRMREVGRWQCLRQLWAQAAGQRHIFTHSNCHADNLYLSESPSSKRLLLLLLFSSQWLNIQSLTFR